MAGLEMAPEIVNIRASDSWNNQPAMNLQKTTDLLMTDRQVEDLLVSGEDDKFLDENSKLHLTIL